MKTLLKSLTAATLAFAVLSSAAVAQTNTPNIDQRSANQQRRIDKGVASGQLNAKEASRMQARQDKLNADIANAKSDGKVTNRERAKLHREENRNSRAIARTKHNNR